MSRPVPLPALTLSERFSRLMGGLQRAVAARAPRDRDLAPLALLLWNRLGRMTRRLVSIAARVRAGRSVRAAVRTPPDRVRSESPAGPGLPGPRWPREFGWLLRLVPETGCFGNQLQHLLADPEMTEILAASPEARRVLRSLCRMLAIAPGPELGLPPRQRQARPKRDAGDGGKPPDAAPHTRAPNAGALRAPTRRERVRRTPSLGWLRWRPAGGPG